MGDVLAELEQVLRSMPRKEKMSQAEEQILHSCKAKAVRGFTVGACAASAATWLATRRLRHGQRFNIAAGSAMIGGMWQFNRSLNACVERILGLQGTRLQMELANLILTKHKDKTTRVQLVSKYFYPEQVFSDSSPDKAFFRWRPRNTYVDDSLYVDNTSVQSGGGDVEGSVYHEKAEPATHYQQAAAVIGDMIVDPFECVLGTAESGTENNQSDGTVTSSKRRLRAHKRAHRRHHIHRARHADISG